MDGYPATKEQWRKLYEIVLAYALRRTGSREQADDVTHDAFMRASTTRSWNPATEPSYAKYMMTIVKSVLSHERKSRAMQSEHETQAVTERQTIEGSSTASAEQVVLDRTHRERRQRDCARQLAALREKLAGFDLELQIIELAENEVDDPPKQAKATGRTIRRSLRSAAEDPPLRVSNRSRRPRAR